MLGLIENFFKNARIPPYFTPAQEGLSYEDVEIRSGERVLKGWLLGEGQEPLIMVHGWGANREVFLPMMRLLAPHFLLLAFDVSNHGESSPYWPVSIRVFWEDIGAAVDFLGEEVWLVGHSMGAASSLIAANTYEKVKGVVALAPFASTEEITERMMGVLPASLRKKVLKKIEEEVGFSLKEFSPQNYICRRKIPHLIIHGKEDETVPVEDSLRLREICPEAESFFPEGEGHKSVLVSEKVLRRVEEFLKKS